MKIATWNVNGIRARHAQVHDWIARDRSDVVCLQELKAAPDQIPEFLLGLGDYWPYWHGGKGYSGVGLLVARSFCPECPAFGHPAFDFEHRIVAVDLPAFTVASVYVPNGGKDYEAKLRFLDALGTWAAEFEGAGRPLVICGDINVARTDLDVHAKERKPLAIGQRPDERALVERVLARGLVDLARALAPEDSTIYTWWPPWRRMRERNIGWRIDYIWASAALAARATSCEVAAAFGTSDHAPLCATFT